MTKCGGNRLIYGYDSSPTRCARGVPVVSVLALLVSVLALLVLVLALVLVLVLVLVLGPASLGPY